MYKQGRINPATVVTLSKGGTGERKVEVGSIQIPDLWHIALNQESPIAKHAILEVWHLAHDLKRHIEEGGEA